MLVLTRRDGETILLRLPNGDEIEVTLISGGPCRLGITAPDDVDRDSQIDGTRPLRFLSLKPKIDTAHESRVHCD